MDDDQLQELLWDDAGDEQQEQDDYDGDKHPLEDELDGRCGPKDCQEDSIPLMEEPPEQPQQRQIPGIYFYFDMVSGVAMRHVVC